MPPHKHGTTSVVFAQDGTCIVTKLAKSDHKALWNDFMMHSTIAYHFDAYRFGEVRIPACYFHVPKDDAEFFAKYPTLVKAAEPVCNLPTTPLVTERILPLTAPIRELLISLYCAPRIKAQAFADPANKDCLVRVYLGSSQGKSGGMAAVGLDVEGLARRMAKALALMHWAAMTDARDVEFVLGSSSKKKVASLKELRMLKTGSYTGPPSRKVGAEDFFHRITELWVLDFNQVKTITLDKAGVDQAVEAVKINDPYLSKPLQKGRLEKSLWNAFVTTYLCTSEDIIKQEEHGTEALQLPSMFISSLIEMEKKRRQEAAEAGARAQGEFIV
ncbi:zinc finger protein-domain-containing protein [Phialemonium atrogriseum]|uniref:Zinc finger protein-domain-containing protein n=1 Tax=Phialemonium atrogriseum TaxID=1093897 RepID=A0AAJ0BTN0_9PEZI|nr:zinc finger protein-domain-containing protein [Phialemonium atrogriseum]KAK1764270.1 zinc finger protein-domain-containing protein [Phialemonium atrogriseum]